MDSNNLKREILTLIIDELGLDDIDVEKINYDAPLFISEDESNEQSLELDSVDALEIIVAIKKKYKIKISDEDKSTLKSISTLAEYVETHMTGDDKSE